MNHSRSLVAGVKRMMAHSHSEAVDSACEPPVTIVIDRAPQLGTCMKSVNSSLVETAQDNRQLTLPVEVWLLLKMGYLLHQSPRPNSLPTLTGPTFANICKLYISVSGYHSHAEPKTAYATQLQRAQKPTPLQPGNSP